MSNQYTVPNIYILGKHIGGFDQLEEAFMGGALRTMLDDAGIKNSLPGAGKHFEATLFDDVESGDEPKLTGLKVVEELVPAEDTKPINERVD
jgi:hypothetical protein